MSGPDIGANDTLEMDLHRPLAQALGKAVCGFDNQPLMQIADAAAIDHGGPETLRDQQCLCGIGASEPNHFEGGSLAELDDACRRTGRLTGGGSGLCHEGFLFGFSSGDPKRPLAAPSLGCGLEKPAE